MKILIKTMGFIGDNIFATSIAKKLKEQYGSECQVDFQLSILAPFELISNDPYIDNVYMEIDSETEYDIVHKLQPIHRKEIPTIQLQKQCGLKNPSSEYQVYTNKNLDYLVNRFLKQYRTENKVLVAYQTNWEEKSFIFTEEEYKRGIDVPNFGYGGKHRDIELILRTLNKYDDIVLFPVGKPNGFNQKSDEIGLVSELSMTSSVLKNVDWFIGSEGGLSNLAAGVGTKTIITGDFVHQLYGWNGVIEKNEEPKLGPEFYFPEFGHVTLNPYLSDVDVANSIAEKLICDCNFK